MILIKTRRLHSCALRLPLLPTYKGARFFATRSDYCRILGVSMNPTRQELRQAYTTLTKKFHPDVCHDKDASNKFHIIHTAYKALLQDIERGSEHSHESVHEAHSYSHEYRREDDYKEFTRRKKAEREAEEKQKERQSHKHYTEEEWIYFKHFGKKYEDDPWEFYDPRNKERRQAYEQEINQYRSHKEKTGDSTRGRDPDEERIHQEMRRQAQEEADATRRYHAEGGKPTGMATTMQLNHESVRLLVALGAASLLLGVGIFIYEVSMNALLCSLTQQKGQKAWLSLIHI
eukprot:TRINITY_DN8230_c0_g1_i2.p1 TRINITY_DN8230_c0_g1~~TRINITY_DN8230_c0_g1_i2.p1  ORF type:complete len:289 (-),score=47.96 TRINITY_DN8230_c0_g1_i2:61-927(-)